MGFKIIFSATFVVLTLIYTFLPNINVDSTTIILVLLIFLPWIMRYLKSLEITGVGKVELLTSEEKNLLDENVEKIKKDNESVIKNKYLNMEDPKLSLAALRIDIEQKLNLIAEENYIKKNRMGITKLANALYERELINTNEFCILKDIIGILNKAVHAKLNDYDVKSYNYIIEIGGELIDSLNSKIKNKDRE